MCQLVLNVVTVELLGLVTTAYIYVLGNRWYLKEKQFLRNDLFENFIFCCNNLQKMSFSSHAQERNFKKE